MIKNKKAETLFTIVIGMVILSFIITALTTIIIDSRNEQNTFNDSRLLTILKNNTSNIATKLSTDNISENSIFYIYKDKLAKEFLIFTWSSNPADPSYENYKYKYIDQYWEKIDLDTFDWKAYQRLLWLEREDTSIDWTKNQVIKAVVKRLIEKN